MATTRLAGGWLFLVGVYYLFSCFQVMGVISGKLTPSLAIEFFAAPIMLIAGSVCLLAHRFNRIAAVAVSLSCAWLTWTFAVNYWPSPFAQVHYDWLFILNTLVILVSGIVLIAVWRTLPHLTKR